MPDTAFALWPVLYQASEAIKRKYLLPVIEDKTTWSMCFPEPEAGSDLAGIRRWNTYYAAWLVDRGGYSAARLQSSLVKGYCIDAGLRVIDRSMQVRGGRGLAIDDSPFSDFYNHLRMCKQMRARRKS